MGEDSIVQTIYKSDEGGDEECFATDGSGYRCCGVLGDNRTGAVKDGEDEKGSYDRERDWIERSAVEGRLATTACC